MRAYRAFRPALRFKVRACCIFIVKNRGRSDCFSWRNVPSPLNMRSNRIYVNAYFPESLPKPGMAQSGNTTRLHAAVVSQTRRADEYTGEAAARERGMRIPRFRYECRGKRASFSSLGRAQICAHAAQSLGPDATSVGNFYPIRSDVVSGLSGLVLGDSTIGRRGDRRGRARCASAT